MLVKQVPRFEAMTLGADGRLQRAGLDLEMNPYCRRAVSKGVELAAETGGTCTVFTLGPPAAEDCLREAIAWGADDGVLITDMAFAGSDTLATARALAAALSVEGPFDLVLGGRNSVDADTGQVAPELAELLGLPFAGGVRELDIAAGVAKARLEYDDGYAEAAIQLPAVLTCAERLCEPCKVDPEGRAAVPGDRMRTLRAADLGAGPWGQQGSPTRVGAIRVLKVERDRRQLSGPVADQVAAAVELLVARGALTDADDDRVGPPLPPHRDPAGPIVAVVVEPERGNVTRELLGMAATLAAEIHGHVVAVVVNPADDPSGLSMWGADAVVALHGAAVEEDVAAGLTAWAGPAAPWAVLTPGTMWGREVAARTAAGLGAGLTGDAVELEVGDGRLVAWKPAFGGALVAAITASSAVQMATVRPGVLATSAPRPAVHLAVTTVAVVGRGRVTPLGYGREDDVDLLAAARCVVGVGVGVPPDDYGALEALLATLGAELAATRKVTDKGWLPRARQVGITGHSIKPRLYVSIGASGKFNHAIGFRAAGTVLAINTNPDALIFAAADIGIVADWRDAVPALTQGLLQAP